MESAKYNEIYNSNSEKAIKNNVRKLVVIHGKGEGVLKEEVRKLLKKFPVEVMDADYQIYGLGATEVRFFST